MASMCVWKWHSGMYDRCRESRRLWRDAACGDGYWWLGVGGYLLCEIGETQGPALEVAFGAFYRHIRQDLSGRDRYVVARKGSPCCV